MLIIKDKGFQYIEIHGKLEDNDAVIFNEDCPYGFYKKDVVYKICIIGKIAYYRNEGEKYKLIDPDFGRTGKKFKRYKKI